MSKKDEIFLWYLFYFTHDQSLDDESGIRLQQGIDQTSGQRGNSTAGNAAGGENVRINDHATAGDKSLG